MMRVLVLILRWASEDTGRLRDRRLGLPLDHTAEGTLHFLAIYHKPLNVF